VRDLSWGMHFSYHLISGVSWILYPFYSFCSVSSLCLGSIRHHYAQARRIGFTTATSTRYCFSPTLTRMSGRLLPALSRLCGST